MSKIYRNNEQIRRTNRKNKPGEDMNFARDRRDRRTRGNEANLQAFVLTNLFLHLACASERLV